MENVKSLINRHNRKTLRETNSKRDQNKTMCNCRDKKSCPKESKFLQKNVVYKSKITTNSGIKEYIGSTGGSFRKRWYAHTSDIKNEKNNGTELSKYIRKLKNKIINYDIK